MAARRLAIDDMGVAEAHPITVVQPLTPAYAAAVYPRTVPRKAIVNQRPFPANGFEQGVGTRHLVVPGQWNVGLVASSDRHTRPLVAQHQNVLSTGAVSPMQKRQSGPLGFDQRL